MLTSQQIDELFAFCRRHYVHYYDVQLELVDHLANAIEEKMLADKKLSFENALNIVYNGFGYKGFAGVVASKEMIVEKQWKKLRWSYFIAYFEWPKAALTIMLFVISFLIQETSNIEFQEWCLIIFPALFFLYELFVSLKCYKRSKKAKDKLLVIRYAYVFPLASLLYFDIFFSINQYSFKHWFNLPELTAYSFYQLAVIFILLFLFSLAYQSTTEKILVQAETQYPRAFAS